MRKEAKRPRTAPDSTKENRPMPKRLASLAAVIAAATLLFTLLPAASASAESPWWQVLTGARPTNMWEPSSDTEVQELKTELFAGLIFAAKIEVGSEVIGCLGAGEVKFLGITADSVCEGATSFPADETAAELQATLEATYGGSVEVSGGPVGGVPFEVRTPGRWVPPVRLSLFKFGSFDLGTASTKLLTKDSGNLIITITNLGDAPVDATETPVTIVDELPEGVVAWGTEAFGGVQGKAGPVDCS
ncbi:MAG TPA: hypothetical protein VN756_00735, partial [Solirubrobacterales bacterium]|nr:hypothetical protein [Solirubrobacterales bacterium]